MSDPALADLADRAGLLVHWEDADRQARTVSDEGLQAALRALGLPASSPAEIIESGARLEAERQEVPPLITADSGRAIELPAGLRPGRARLLLESGEALDVEIEPASGGRRLRGVREPGYHLLESGGRRITLAVAPWRAFTLEDAAPGRRLWGVGVQVYSLRDTHPSGFGDFGALASFAAAVGARGADVLAISPVHALFAADPDRFSPYGPSTRLFLNGLYADPALVLGKVQGPAPTPADEALLIEWSAAWPAKLERLRALHAAFRQTHPGLAPDFAAFCAAGGEDLRGHALFEALHGHFFRAQGACGWQDWPSEFQDPASAQVASFARANAGEVEFHLFLQWLADRSLAAAQDRARRSGMAVGLIADLAVGMDPGGSHAWSRRSELIAGLSVGAPPDPLGPSGQDWGVTAFSPSALRRAGYQGFLATLRSAMAHAGGVRIDHAMGLRRLWLVPHGAGATEGVYLTYPFEDLLRLLVLESWRAKAIVIGEDLGTVPPGFRESLYGRGIMGMQVLWFEREAGGFIPPGRWSSRAAALTSTHDVPTIAGWWRGRDIDWTFGLARKSPFASDVEARQAREREREDLWRASREAGVVDGAPPAQDNPGPAVDAAIGLVARTPSRLAVIQAEDLFGLEEQPNLPATTFEHPNWRRRLPAPSEALFEEPDVAHRTERLAAERPRGGA
jgi:4-alpha-glucanotransferase